MTPEETARAQIDAMLAASGWLVQAKDRINVSANRGVAICELSFATGEPDYTLFVEGKALGTLEAKPSGVTLTSVEEQSSKYVAGVPSGLPAWKSPLPFCYESTGEETFFTSRLDPQPRSRRVFSFHRPASVSTWLRRDKTAGGASPAPCPRSSPGIGGERAIRHDCRGSEVVTGGLHRGVLPDTGLFMRLGGGAG